MGLISWIIIGGIAGWLASMVMKTDKEMGAMANIVVGVVGALVGGFIVQLLGAGQGVNGFNLWSLAVALLGSVVLLAIVKALRR